MEQLGFYVCVEDLEDELIRAHGAAAVERVIEAEGDLGSFRTLQKQPAWEGRPVEEQLRRFMGSGGSRKIRYARLLVDALDLEMDPAPARPGARACDLVRAVRVGVLLAIALLLTACSSGDGRKAITDATPSSRSKQCTARLLAGIKGNRGPIVQRYIQRTYCDRFARHGWVYEDGTLSIKAHLWVMNGYTCSEDSRAPADRRSPFLASRRSTRSSARSSTTSAEPRPRPTSTS